MNKTDALAIARIECEKRNELWREPVSVSWGLFHYTVWTHSGYRGCNVCVKIRKRDGTIARFTVMPR